MSFTVRKHGDTVVIDVGSQLVTANRLELKATVLDELERGARHFRVDFGRTRYVDSSGIAALVSLSKRVRERGGALRVANLNDDLTTLFKLTKLDALFPLDDNGDGTAGGGVLAPVRPPPGAGGAEESAR